MVKKQKLLLIKTQTLSHRIIPQFILRSFMIITLSNWLEMGKHVGIIKLVDKKCSSRPITIVVTASIIIPTSIDARTKMIDLRERESTEISDTN